VSDVENHMVIDQPEPWYVEEDDGAKADREYDRWRWKEDDKEDGIDRKEM